ncbi:hypothetical protein WJX72_008385 [[Myrmecia] bisecta]|uniref:RecA family profile 1 domain-containing protein n=1 Tax=[Myrmecia] bisecta TaxID=41462 RepID=A0AAW1QRZ7_9CHLO
MRPRPLSADLVWPKCTLGCPLLDKVLRGGLASNSITELVGEAAAAKTQTCLQLLLCAQKPASEGGLAGSALYIYTEGDPPLRRLQELANYQKPSSCPANNPFDHIYIERDITSGEELLACLERVRRLLSSPPGRPLRLIVIDSIAYIFRDVGDNASVGAYVERTGLLFQIASLLRRYADEYNVAVVVTNQVMDAVSAAESGGKAPAARHTGGLKLMSDGRQVIPALGLAWANCVHTRIFLARAQQMVVLPDDAVQQAHILRTMQVVFSPYLPQSLCHYLVTQAGVISPENLGR